MAVSVEMQHTGDSGLQAEVRAVIEHVLADRLGDWRVSIVGSQANDPMGDEDCWPQRLRAMLHARGFCRRASAGSDSGHSE